MRCYSCNSKNPSSAFYCSQCGSSLRSATKLSPPSPARPADRNLVLYGGVTILVLSFAFLTFLSISGKNKNEQESRPAPVPEATAPVIPPSPAVERTHPPPQPQNGSVATEDFNNDSGNWQEAHTARSPGKPKDGVVSKQEPSNVPPLLGSAIVFNPWGSLLAELPAAVSRDGWLAMPMAAMLGGRTFIFRGSAVGEINIDRGLWRNGDPVGLWRLDGENPLNAPELRIWSETLPLSWQSLQPGAVAVQIQVTPMADLGIFIRCNLPPEITAPGVLLQEGHIVGWTFGAWDSSGYLWDGDTTAIRSTTTVFNYYRQTFQGGREEQFAMALAMGEGVLLADRITALCEGFLRPPKLSVEQTPTHFRKETISNYLASLVSAAIQQGLERQVAASLTTAVLKEADNPILPSEAVKALLASAGYEEAIHMAAEMAQHFEKKNQMLAQQLNAEEVRLYLDYLRILRDNGNTRYGWRIWDEARRAFPQELGINLLGVEFALADGNWQEAERLLYRFEYPMEYKDKSDLLANRISELKSQEGKIVIRFTPGASAIPVNALLNGRVTQRFLIDTGATFVTVPKAALDALGIRVNVSDPATHRVSTAGGVMYAKSVTLASIELEGWAVDNIPVLVLDIPDQPGLGLLGLNFLNRFRMDLQTEKGTLILSPR